MEPTYLLRPETAAAQAELEYLTLVGQQGNKYDRTCESFRCNSPPVALPLGVKGAASAAFGDIMFLGGVDGVNDGESTLNFPLPKLFRRRALLAT
jgi:hypothetical protein